MTIETRYSIGDRLFYFIRETARRVEFICDEIHIHKSDIGYSEWYRGKGVKNPVPVDKLQKVR